MSKRTPPQNALLRRLRDAGAIGLSADSLHDLTLSSLVRRGDAYVSFGRAYPCHRVDINPDTDDTPDGAA